MVNRLTPAPGKREAGARGRGSTNGEAREIFYKRGQKEELEIENMNAEVSGGIPLRRKKRKRSSLVRAAKDFQGLDVAVI